MPDLVEYMLVIALIALVVASGIHILEKPIGKSTAASANTLQAVTAGQQGDTGSRQGGGGGQHGGGDQHGGGHH
jgi:hypothetical protein